MSQTIATSVLSMIEIVCIQVTVEEFCCEMVLTQFNRIFPEVHPCGDIRGSSAPSHGFFQSKERDTRVPSMHSHVDRFRVGVLTFAYPWSSFLSHVEVGLGSLGVCAKHEAMHVRGDSIRGWTRTTNEMRHDVRIRSNRPVHPTSDPNDRHRRRRRSFPLDASRHCATERPLALHVVPSLHEPLPSFHPSISPRPSSIMHAYAMVRLTCALVQSTTCSRGGSTVLSPGGNRCASFSDRPKPNRVSATSDRLLEGVVGSVRTDRTVEEASAVSSMDHVRTTAELVRDLPKLRPNPSISLESYWKSTGKLVTQVRASTKTLVEMDVDVWTQNDG